MKISRRQLRRLIKESIDDKLTTNQTEYPERYGNCGMLALALIEEGIRREISGIEIVFVTTENEDEFLEVDEPEIHHVVMWLDGKYYDDRGEITRKQLGDFSPLALTAPEKAKPEEGRDYLVLAYKIQNNEELEMAADIVKNNTDWWKSCEEYVQRAKDFWDDYEMKITRGQLRKPIREAVDSQDVDPRLAHLGSIGWKIKPSANFPARLWLPSDRRVGLDVVRLDGVWWLEAYIVDSKGNNRYPSKYGDKFLANEYPPVEGSDLDDPMYDHFIKSGYIDAMTELFFNLDDHADLLQDEDYASTLINLAGNELLEKYDTDLVTQIQDDFIKLTGINQ